MARSQAIFTFSVLVLLQFPSTAWALGYMKFQLWFYQWQNNQLASLETGPCAAVVHDYWNPKPNDTYLWKCTRALDCILTNTSPSALQMLSTSVVLLGLTPTMLASLGPNLAESSMLTQRRSVLPLLLSFGAPAVMVSRIWTYEDPFKTIVAPERAWSNSSKLLDFIDPKRMRLKRYRLPIVVVEYMLVLAAIANIVSVSLDLGWRSVCSWNCDISYFPLAWALVPGAIHALAWLSYVMIPKRVEESKLSTAVKGADAHDSGKSTPPQVIVAEHPTAMSLVIYSLAVGLAVGHVMFGTMVFSSLMFLMVSDAVPVIIRYAASALVCRFINKFELALMREEYAVIRVDSISDRGLGQEALIRQVNDSPSVGGDV